MTENELSSINLEDIFRIRGYSSKEYILKLSPISLSIRLQGNDNDRHSKTIPINDMYGCLCMKSKANTVQCHLTIYLYSLQRSKYIPGAFSKKESLHRSEQVFTYGKFNDFESNFGEVTRWHRCITQAIYLRRNLPHDIMAKRDKRVLVFINPAGGAGKAYDLMMEYVVGVWSEAEFNYHMMVTEYAGHARDYVKTIQLADWSGIVLASGDGLIFEVINGLMSRDDWQEALKLPLGHIPGGSGNAFITNIMHYCKQSVKESMEKFAVQAAVLIATHNVLPFDMAIVDICDGQRLFAFLCIEWGIIADVDCESEKYRFLGEARFTVEAVKRILHPRIYNGYIDYIPYEDTDDSVNTNQITSDITTQLHQHLLPLNEQIPTDSTTTKWRRINGPFTHVLVTSKSSIAKDILASPQSTLADGYLTLQFIRANGATRMNLAKTFLKIESGDHFNYNFVERMRVRAFRIVPSDTEGNMMVDGEKVPFGPIQGEILPSLGRCMAKQLRVESVSTDA